MDENKDNIMNKLPDTKTVDKKVMKVATVLLIILIFLIVVASMVMSNALMPYNREDTSKKEFKVEQGWGSSTVVQKLEEQHLIKNAFLIKLYLKISPKNEIKAGTYELSPSMSVDDIFKVLSGNKSLENATVQLRLIEGKRFVDYADTIATTFGFDKEDVIAKSKDKEYLNKLIKDYWFISDDILNEKIYYPLEGYLFPDTYDVLKSSSIEDVFEVLITELGNKLSIYKEDIESKNIKVHSLLTLASMVELEAGTGKVTLDDGKTATDREVVASVFDNRLKINMKLGSDVTTYYGAGKTLQEDISPNLNDCNGYNTRGECVPGLPVGPICSPSLSSIVASLNPATTGYYYFVADKNGKLYYAINQEGHDKNISYLKDHDLWA